MLFELDMDEAHNYVHALNMREVETLGKSKSLLGGDFSVGPLVGMVYKLKHVHIAGLALHEKPKHVQEAQLIVFVDGEEDFFHHFVSNGRIKPLESMGKEFFIPSIFEGLFQESVEEDEIVIVWQLLVSSLHLFSLLGGQIIVNTRHELAEASHLLHELCQVDFLTDYHLLELLCPAHLHNFPTD